MKPEVKVGHAVLYRGKEYDVTAMTPTMLKLVARETELLRLWPIRWVQRDEVEIING